MKTWSAVCDYSVKSQFEICGLYSKKRYTREVIGLRKNKINSFPSQLEKQIPR